MQEPIMTDATAPTSRAPRSLSTTPTPSSTAPPGLITTSGVWPAGPPRVGATASRSREVMSADIERFTAISGDRNPLHYDVAAAAATRLGGIVVQGGVITAILNAVVAEDLPGPGTVFLHTDWSFQAPVRPGDIITGHVEVLHVRTDKPITRLANRVTRDDGTLSVSGEALCYTFPLAAA
jgi:acyl dehydratase